jgi:NTE family protein
LVLSGGGAKGLAHVAVIQVLDSLGARPDLVVGTSMGALVGALYASGYSGREIDSIARAHPPAQLFESGAPRVPRPWQPLIPLLVWEQGAQGFALQSPALRETEANMMLSALLLRGNLQARGSFDSLAIPFRAIATDFATREAVILGGGDLAQAVRASIAVPLIFPPERIERRVLTDGGLSANIPVGVARALGADRLIVSDVSGRRLDPDELTNPLAAAEQLAAFLFQQTADSLGPDDVRVRIGVEDFRALDFRPRLLDSIRARGRRAADSMLPRAPCLPARPLTPRPLPRRVAGFSITGGTETDQQVLARLLGLNAGSTLDPEALGAQLDRLGDTDGFKAVWLYPTGTGDSVVFRAQVHPGPRRLAGGTFAYDNDLGGRAGAAYLDRRFLGSPLEFSAVGGFGRRRRDLTAALRLYFGYARSGFAPMVEARAAEEVVPLYTPGGREVGRPLTQEATAFAGLEHEFSRDWIVRLGLDARLWRDADTTLARRLGRGGKSAGVAARLTHTPGPVTVTADVVWSGTFRLVSGDLAWETQAGRFTLIRRVRVGWGEHLPHQARFPLGGDEGYPGLAVQEVRGDRELFVGLQSVLPLHGPLSARLLLAAGRVGVGGSLVDFEDWIAGARAGIGVETPLGPVRFEYGVATRAPQSARTRSALFVRIGRWF